MKRKTLLNITVAFLFVLPVLVSAVETPKDFKGLVGLFVGIITLLFPILLGLILLAFFWGLIKFLAAGGNEDSIKEGKKVMFWGIIALFVVVSIGAIVGFLRNSFGFSPFQPLPEKANNIGGVTIEQPVQREVGQAYPTL